MRGGLTLMAILVVMAGSSAGTRNVERDHELLPTAALAREVRSLQGPAAMTAATARSRVAMMRERIGDFIVRQIRAYPSIEACALQTQLAAVLAVRTDCNGVGDNAAPRVFVQPWGPENTHRVFGVTYQWWGFYGKGGSETILESYVWSAKNGVRRSAGLVPRGFDGLLTQTTEVGWFPGPDRYWALVSGTVGGASGRAISGSAAVFEIGPDEIRMIWSAPPDIGNVRAFTPPGSLHWEIEYVDMKRFYGGLPRARLLDIFQIDDEGGSFRRLVHQLLD